MVLYYGLALICSILFLRVCLLQAAIPHTDSMAKVVFDIIPYGTFAIFGILAGYYCSEKHFNPDRHFFEPKHSDWQALFLSSGTAQFRKNLANKFLYLSEKRQHRFWFEVLLSTTQNFVVSDRDKRLEFVRYDLERKHVRLTSIETFRRIAKTLRYQELEAKSPYYILLAAKDGDELAKNLRRYLPLKARFFWKKTTINIHK
jgi:hypothetical protein